MLDPDPDPYQMNTDPQLCLRVCVDLPLPLVDGAHAGDDVHTGRQLTTKSQGLKTYDSGHFMLS